MTFPLILNDFDIKQLKNTRDEIYHSLSKYGIIVFKNQKLTVQEQQDILTENFYLNKDYSSPEVLKYLKDILVPNSNILIRVTAQRNENNQPGAFNNIEGLSWHSDNPTNKDDRLLTWLYGYTGTVGSVTEYCNTNLAFNDLDDDLKQLAKSLYAQTTNRFIEKENSTHIIPLYNHCGLGYYSWTFPYKQITQFVGYSVEESKELIERLLPHILQDKYCYTHQWEDNDLIISNERILIHRRPYYENMESRILHKGTMGFLH